MWMAKIARYLLKMNGASLYRISDYLIRLLLIIFFFFFEIVAKLRAKWVGGGGGSPIQNDGDSLHFFLFFL